MCGGEDQEPGFTKDCCGTSDQHGRPLLSSRRSAERRLNKHHSSFMSAVSDPTSGDAYASERSQQAHKHYSPTQASSLSSASSLQPLSPISSLFQSVELTSSHAAPFFTKDITVLKTDEDDKVNIRANAMSTSKMAHGQQFVLTDSSSPSLHHYAACGDHKKIEDLLREMHIDLADNQGRTALHFAAANGQLGAVKLLVTRCADVSRRARNGKMPMHYAADSNHSNVVKYLATQYRAQRPGLQHLKDYTQAAPCSVYGAQDKSVYAESVVSMRSSLGLGGGGSGGGEGEREEAAACITGVGNGGGVGGGGGGGGEGRGGGSLHDRSLSKSDESRTIMPGNDYSTYQGLYGSAGGLYACVWRGLSHSRARSLSTYSLV